MMYVERVCAEQGMFTCNEVVPDIALIIRLCLDNVMFVA